LNPLRTFALLMAAIAAGFVLTSPRAHAGWWGTRAPVDYEECADAAEKAATREAKAAALIECNARFAGRRKPGGGYTYFDFMQNRTFDIAGPNPTPEEQKRIDEQYTEFLDRERQSSIEAAFAAKQQQQQLQRATLQERDREGTRASAGAEQATRRRHQCQASESLKLRKPFLLLRLAAAFRKAQRPEESAVRLFFNQRQTQLTFAVVADGAGISGYFNAPGRIWSGVNRGEPLPAASALLINATMRRESGACSPRRSAIPVMTPCR
jgi:hypothetical protein